MPAFDPSTPRVPAKYAGIDLTVPMPFTGGQSLTDLEAKFLNRALAGTVGNQFGGDIRRALADLDAKEPKKAPHTFADLGWDAQAEYDSKFSAYVLGTSNRGIGAGTTSADPVTRFAREIASGKVKELIRAKGLKVADWMKAPAKSDPSISAFTNAVNQYIERNPWVQSLAQSQVDAMNSAQGSDVDLGDVGAAPAA